MDIALFFDAVDEHLLDNLSKRALGDAIHVNAISKPSLEGKEIALFSVGGEIANFDPIRTELYNLQQSNISYSVVDLGHLRSENKTQAIERTKEVCAFLKDKKIIPIVLGQNHELDAGQFQAFEHSKETVNLTVVDHSFDLETNEGDGHLYSNITNSNVLLDQYTHLGYQSFYTDYEAIHIFEKLNFEGFRLGYLKEELKEIEPSIRKSHIMSFDLSSIKYGESKGCSVKNPFGLTGEEACQIAWYAGLSDRMSSFGIYDYVSVDDVDMQTAKICSTMLWYFIDGVAHRRDSQNFETNDYLKYTVFLNRTGEDLIFYKNIRTDKWWLKAGEDVIPCSYKDYKLAASGEIPDRWLNEIVRRS